MDNKDILQSIAEQITEFRTWQSFSMVSKVTMKICKSIWDKKKYELSTVTETFNNKIYSLPYITQEEGSWPWRIETVKHKEKIIEEYIEHNKPKIKIGYFDDNMIYKTVFDREEYPCDYPGVDRIYYTEYYHQNGLVRYCGYHYNSTDYKFGYWNTYDEDGNHMSTDTYSHDRRWKQTSLNIIEYKN